MSQPVSDRPILLDPAERPAVKPSSVELPSPEPSAVEPPSNQPDASQLDSIEQPFAELRFDLSQAITPLAMENNAAVLMDRVFAEVDQILERGTSLAVEPPEPAPEAPQPQPIFSIDAILPPKIGPRDLMPQPVELLEVNPTTEDGSAPSAEAESVKANHGWSPLWLAVLCSSLLLSAGILCFLFRDQVSQAWLAVLGKSSESAPATVADAPTDPQAQQNSDFLKYLARALDRLAQKSEVEPSPVVSISPAASPSPTVVERVYVPVYPSAQTPVVSAPTAAAQSPSAASTPATAQAAPPVAANPLPSVAPSVIPNIAAASTHTLIGVLELGDRSAALFDVNGTPQRIRIGEAIGASGWTLVSISNQEAIVRRNGEVRSIHVGQKF